MSVKIDISQFVKWRDHLVKMEKEIPKFTEYCTKKLAQRLLAMTIKLTPVGKYYLKTPEKYKIANNKKGISVGDVKLDKKGNIKYKRATKKGIDKIGGTLRRGWIAKTQQEAESKPGKPQEGDIQNYLNSLYVVRSGNRCQITIFNPVEYASFVEFGHRTRGGKDWVSGRFMLTESEQELQGKLQSILEPLLTEFMIKIFEYKK